MFSKYLLVIFFITFFQFRLSNASILKKNLSSLNIEFNIGVLQSEKIPYVSDIKNIGINFSFPLYHFFPEFVKLKMGMMYSLVSTIIHCPSCGFFLKDYLQIPIALQIYPIKDHSFYIISGLENNFLLNAIRNRRIIKSVKKEFNTLQINSLLGIGYETKFGLGFMVKYKHPLYSPLKKISQREQSGFGFGIHLYYNFLKFL